MHAAIMLHVLSAVVWVGGMFFAYIVLRPVAASLLEPPQRLTLWIRVFASFFVWVWVAVGSLLLTGYGMLFGIFGGMAHAPLHVHVMHGLGLLMTAIFLHVFFAPYRRLTQSVSAQNWKEGGHHLAQIRKLTGTNLVLGLVVVVVASGGRYLT